MSGKSEVEYPTSDGQPMAESQEHLRVMIDLIVGLQRRFAPMPDAWVSGNFFLFYEQGNPKARVSPDVLLARGLSGPPSRYYLLWEETVPSLVVEVTSRKTRSKDMGFKKQVYERIGIEEYILFDPMEDYLRPQLQGYRLMRGRYQPMPLVEDGTLLSRTARLRMRPEGQRLRLIDAVTAEPILWPEEAELARGKAERARQEAETARQEAEAAKRGAEARAQAAEVRAKALEEELKRLRQG